LPNRYERDCEAYHAIGKIREGRDKYASVGSTEKFNSNVIAIAIVIINLYTGCFLNASKKRLVIGEDE
jgi:hypothetical protein